MSIENNLERIATSLELIAKALSDRTVAVASPVVEVAPAPVAAPAPAPMVEVAPAPIVAAPVVEVAPAPVAAPAPVVVQPVVEAPKPVATPVVTEVVHTVVVQDTPAVASPSSAPFSDPKGLIGYMMAAYKQLGPIKGASLQQVLEKLGHTNVNNVQPAQYGELYAAVEALKA